MTKSSRSSRPSVMLINRQAREDLVLGQMLNVGGLDCEVVSDARAEQADFVVCTALTIPLVFGDNQIGPCYDCGDPLQWRPQAPHRPPRICFDCVITRELSAGERKRQMAGRKKRVRR